MCFVTALSAQTPNGTYVPITDMAKQMQFAKFVFSGSKVKIYLGMNGISLGVANEYSYSLSGKTLSIKEGATSVEYLTYDKTSDQISYNMEASYELLGQFGAMLGSANGKQVNSKEVADAFKQLGIQPPVWGKEGTNQKNSTTEPVKNIKKGKLIFLTHGLNDGVSCFEETVKSLKNDKEKYFELGYITMRDNSKSPVLHYAKNYSPSVKNASNVNELINKGQNVLVRIEFSDGNLSFNEQFSQMDKMLFEFEGHSADVVFIGHSMGGLASIRYGMYYAKNNPSKKVKIITVDTPYQPNYYARTVWGGKNEKQGLISEFSEWSGKQKRGNAHRDLGGYKDDVGNFALLDLRNKWNEYKKYSGTAELFAISVSINNDSRWSEVGDGIVDIPAQQGNFLENLDNVGKWNAVTLKPTIFGKGGGKGFYSTKNPYFHSNTPALLEVIKQISNIVEIE